jgi:hypothetical protein
MLWLFLFFIWIWLLISIFADVFRRDMAGSAKALWVLFLIILPLLGALIYLMANGGDMQARSASEYQAVEQAQQDYIRSVAGGGGTADELEKLAKLRDAGTITSEEFAAQKAKLLA